MCNQLIADADCFNLRVREMFSVFLHFFYRFNLCAAFSEKNGKLKPKCVIICVLFLFLSFVEIASQLVLFYTFFQCLFLLNSTWGEFSCFAYFFKFDQRFKLSALWNHERRFLNFLNVCYELRCLRTYLPSYCDVFLCVYVCMSVYLLWEWK